MLFALLAAAAAQPASPAAADLEASARERGIAFAKALESGAAPPNASPKIVWETYFRPRYRWTKSDPAGLRAALAGCRRGDSWVYVYGPRSQYVALRYHCPSDRPRDRWPVLEQDIENGQIGRAWVASGPRQLERSKVRESRLSRDSSFAADSAAARAMISAIQAGRTRLPHARPGIELHHMDNMARKREARAAAAVLRRALAGCTPGAFEAEPRRWLGSRLAMVTFSCPANHKPHPQMVVMLELLDGGVQTIELESGPPPPPMVSTPAPF